MGILSSRQQPNRELDEAVPAHVYRYPPKSGTFFGAHFMMGGERFEVGQSDMYLFGENSDLNFFGAKPVQFPYPQSTSAEPTRPLYCSVAIRRDSLKLTKVPNSESAGSSSVSDESDDPTTKFNVEFLFDCDASCTITVYYFATEESTPNGLRYVSKRPELTSKSYQYDVGANQTFSQSEHFFDPTIYKTEELLYNQNTEVIPIVIHCVAESPDNGMGPQSHSTLAVVERSAEAHGTGFVLKALKQKLYVDGVCYLLQEIYGIENKHLVPHAASTTAVPSDDPNVPSTAPHDDGGESGAECVVCMSDLRDTLILPCRHLCLCSACAETLRYKASNCPICRSPFRALLQIKALRKIRTTLLSNLPGGDQMDGSGNSSFLNRYEQVPLIEALNGPIECPTAITLPHLPTIPMSHTAPALMRVSPRPPPRRGQGRKRTAKMPLPIQEVLTAQSIPKYNNNNAESLSDHICVNPTVVVDGINNSSYLPGQAESDNDDFDDRSVTCGVVVKKPELETATDDDEESDSSYRTPMAEKRVTKSSSAVEFCQPTFCVHNNEEDTRSVDSDVGVAAGDESDTNEIPATLNGMDSYLADERHRDETPLSSFSVGSATSTKHLLTRNVSGDELRAVDETELKF